MNILLFCANCTWEIVPMLLGAWILGGLFWFYILSPGSRKKSNDLAAENLQLKDRLQFLESEKETLRNQHFRLIQEHDALVATSAKNQFIDSKDGVLPNKQTGIHFINSNQQKELNYDGLFDSHDLKIIEGIGPKIESILKQAKINTWKDLAKTKVNRLQHVLETANTRYRVHNPTSWPEQARLADEQRWKELVNLQKAMNEGIGDVALHAKLEKLAIKKLGLALHEHTDLKVVEGIGPKIEWLLKKSGIKNWSDLAKSNVYDLRGILDTGGERFRLANPESWPEQADLADNGYWQKLKEFQQNLTKQN